MEAHGSRLRETHGKELEVVRDKMAEYLPHSVGVHGFLDLMIKCRVENIPNKVYTPEDPKSSTLVVVTPSCSQEHIQSLTLFWDTATEDDREILHLLKTLPNFDWEAPTYFRVNPLSVYVKLQGFIDNGELGDTPRWCYTILEGPSFIMRPSDIEKFTIPSGFSLDALRLEDVQTVLDAWDYNWTESHKGIEWLIANLPSVAIRTDAEASKPRRLVAWTFLHNLGFLGNTYTVPEYRRRGLGMAVAFSLAEKLARVGVSVRSIVDASNTASLRYHERLRFRRESDSILFVMLPKGKVLRDFV